MIEMHVEDDFIRRCALIKCDNQVQMLAGIKAHMYGLTYDKYIVNI